MRCFYHPDRPAVGLCTLCERGLCPDCAAPVGELLACRDRHEQHVEAVALTQQASAVQARRTGAGYARNGVFNGLVGLAFTLLGALQIRYLGLQAVFLVIIGLFLLYAAAANFLEARRFR